MAGALALALGEGSPLPEAPLVRVALVEALSGALAVAELEPLALPTAARLPLAEGDGDEAPEGVRVPQPLLLCVALAQPVQLPVADVLGVALSVAVPLAQALCEAVTVTFGEALAPPPGEALGTCTLGEGLLLLPEKNCTAGGVAQRAPPASRPQGVEDAEREAVTEALGLGASGVREPAPVPLTLPQALAGALGEAPAVPATLPLGDAVARSVPLTAALAEGGSEAVPPRALALGALAEGLALALGVCTESGVAQKTPSAS